MVQQNANRCEAPSWHHTDPDQREFSAILKDLKQDPSIQGCISLGKDGVLRSLITDRDVVDAAGLSPKQITACLHRLPAGFIDETEYAGVDGTKVPRMLWLKPDKNILPSPLSQEKSEDLGNDC